MLTSAGIHFKALLIKLRNPAEQTGESTEVAAPGAEIHIGALFEQSQHRRGPVTCLATNIATTKVTIGPRFRTGVLLFGAFLAINPLLPPGGSMRIYIGLFTDGTPHMFDYPNRDDHAVGDIHFGASAGTAWLEHHSFDETKVLEFGSERKLPDGSKICAFENRGSRLMWLREVSENQDIQDPNMDDDVLMPNLDVPGAFFVEPGRNLQPDLRRQLIDTDCP